MYCAASQMEEMHQARCGMAGAVSMPSPVGPRVPPSQHMAVFTNLAVSVFLLKFNYIGMID